MSFRFLTRAAAVLTVALMAGSVSAAVLLLMLARAGAWPWALLAVAAALLPWWALAAAMIQRDRRRGPTTG